MNRRRLLQGAATLAALLPVTGLHRRANANLPPLPHPVLVHTMMLGGPDFRHLLPPAYASDPNSYGNAFYRVRASALRIDATPAAWEAHWRSAYIPLDDGRTGFGMLAGCDWLADMWRAGNVAIIANVVGAESRDHEHAQRVWESADRTLSQVSTPRTGWGGRLADATGGNVFSLTPTPRPFCFNRNPDDALSPGTRRVITLSDPQAIGLYTPPPAAEPTALGIHRALQQYYAAVDATLPAGAPQRQFTAHEHQLRALGDRLRPLFDALVLPPEIEGLTSGATALATRPLAAQVRNLYHALAAAGEVDVRAASLAFGNWDSHDLQQAEIEPKLRDMFGAQGAFARLYRVLPDTVSSRLVLMFSGEFGRQLRANGDAGTDHGRGNCVLLVGLPVRGGIYGELFPDAELARLEEPTPDIDGRTHLDALLGPLLDYLAPGTADAVLPARATASVEAGVMLGGLFQT